MTKLTNPKLENLVVKLHGQKVSVPVIDGVPLNTALDDAVKELDLDYIVDAARIVEDTSIAERHVSSFCLFPFFAYYSSIGSNGIEIRMDGDQINLNWNKGQKDYPSPLVKIMARDGNRSLIEFYSTNGKLLFTNSFSSNPYLNWKNGALIGLGVGAVASLPFLLLGAAELGSIVTTGCGAAAAYLMMKGSAIGGLLGYAADLIFNDDGGYRSSVRNALMRNEKEEARLADKVKLTGSSDMDASREYGVSLEKIGNKLYAKNEHGLRVEGLKLGAAAVVGVYKEKNGMYAGTAVRCVE